MNKIKTDVFILGAGAGGIGLAHFLVSNGIKTAVCDKNPYFGGTAVFSGVCCFEPGVSFDGLHMQLKDYLLKANGGFVCKTYPNISLFYPELKDDYSCNDFNKYCWGLSAHDPNGEYSDTLMRCKMFWKNGGAARRFQFYDFAMLEALKHAFKPFEKNLIPLFNTRFSDVKVNAGKISSVILSEDKASKDKIEVTAKIFVDCTGDIILARASGCDYIIDSEGKDAYNEPSANEQFENNINGITYVFKVTKTQNPKHIDLLSPDTMEVEFNRNTVSCFNLYPNDDIIINMLPTMDGARYSPARHEECLAIVKRYWSFLQQEKGMSGYTLEKIYNPGIRESYRLKGRYVLNENDLIRGIFRQENPERFAAIADHMRDIHGKCGLSKELETPFGIPIESLETKELENLYVCSRGASFSHIAASSARLTRTLISAGEGLGSFISSEYFNIDNNSFITQRLKTIEKLEEYL